MCRYACRNGRREYTFWLHGEEVKGRGDIRKGRGDVRKGGEGKGKEGRGRKGRGRREGTGKSRAKSWHNSRTCAFAQRVQFKLGGFAICSPLPLSSISRPSPLPCSYMYDNVLA